MTNSHDSVHKLNLYQLYHQPYILFDGDPTTTDIHTVTKLPSPIFR